ncbi:hypothetical protein HOU39_gp164 [Lactobacillus phage Iacchus]|uniref:Uncharacterized protein n=2 Tax=Harbinvirus TaxID=2732970 RepID=A0A3Q8HYN9_9CAUD|nr:hypothetical protein HOU39_gp164 [Lactobacillus phage Iacchus]YP_009814555.1 hypothetical protein HOU40_gp168 [Lactobacillus phage Bromius]AYH92058.1 hypothetical protein [Lactobacillus phage Iacchus]AYH92230.1 hypothetical protein [Lactobacillus phage Dionysus]AYH92404.1 hypothetical protein [Lactobacillus phage Bromius]
MDNKLISSRTAGIPERIIAATRTADIPEQTVIDKSTIFEDGIIGEKVLSKEVVDKLNLIDKLQQENNDLMNRVKRLEKIINEKL